MFGFLKLGRKLSHSWLSPEPPGEQDHLSAARRKAELRQIFRDSREKLKQHAYLHKDPWGAAHIQQLSGFLHQQGVCSNPGLLSLRTGEIAAYWPIGSELELLPELQQSSRLKPDPSTARWWLPITRPDKQMEWFQICDEIHTWPKDKLGLPVPPEAVFKFHFSARPEAPWLVLTPCLAADRNGTRLGYGGGFYDRFLQQHGRDCLSVACVPEALFLEKDAIPADKHDVAVDIVVTENQVWIRDEKTVKDKLKRFT
jgi:5,10-methenyltetrahydrofolate synthetase